VLSRLEAEEYVRVGVMQHGLLMVFDDVDENVKVSREILGHYLD